MYAGFKSPSASGSNQNFELGFFTHSHIHRTATTGGRLHRRGKVKFLEFSGKNLTEERKGTSGREGEGKMLPQQARKAIAENPKMLANLIDLVNLPSTLREFVGQSQISRLGCFMHVWSYIKTNNLQDPNNKNLVNCDEKLRGILLGKPQIELAELPMLIKLHFPKVPK